MIAVTHGGIVKEHPLEDAGRLPYENGTCDAIEVKEGLVRFVGDGAVGAQWPGLG